jgi:hypothetical protein
MTENEDFPASEHFRLLHHTRNGYVPDVLFPQMSTSGRIPSRNGWEAGLLKELEVCIRTLAVIEGI